MSVRKFYISKYVVSLVFALTACVGVHAGPEQGHSDHEDVWPTQAAAKRIHWRDETATTSTENRVFVKLLAINDFHGQLSTGRKVGVRPVGGAAILASYLKAAQKAAGPDQTIFVHAGDQVGASPPDSALLQDEPSIQFLNMLVNEECSYKDRTDKECNFVGTPGNHEFDKGKEEMMRLIFGGNSSKGPFLEDPYRGARFPYVSANVVDAKTGRPILPPYVIKEVHGARIAFIGATVKETPTLVTPTGVAGLRFLDEADAINRYIPELKAKHVHAVVVLIHQGGFQQLYSGTTQSDAVVQGDIVNIVSRLDNEVDVVVAGHTHSFTNVLLPGREGKPILVTEAFFAGTAYGDIDIEIDRRSGDVVAKSAAIVVAYGDEGPGVTPDPGVAKLVSAAQATVKPLIERVIGTAAADVLQTQNSAGESPLGDLIADGQRAAMGTDFAIMQPNGIRANIYAGPVSWGALFTVHPFGNTLVKMELTGQQLYDLFNQQWVNQPFPRMLQISGLTYTWDNARPVGDRIIEIRQNGTAVDRTRTYTVTVNNFIAAGGDNFTVLTQGKNLVVGPVDLDALIAYIESLPQPFSASTDGRVMRLN